MIIGLIKNYTAKMRRWSSLFTIGTPSSTQPKIPSHGELDKREAYKKTTEELDHACHLLEREHKVYVRTDLENLSLRCQQKNQNLSSHLSSCQHDLIRVREQSRRKEELCNQLKAEAIASEAQHHQQLSSLYAKINALETDLHVVSEEDCVKEWQRLRRNLDFWVKGNFKDTAQLREIDYSAVFQSDETTDAHTWLPTGSSHQKWAIIQAFIARMIHNNILSQYEPGLPEYENVLFFELDRQIFERCVFFASFQGFLLTNSPTLGSMNTWTHCKSGINKALGAITMGTQKALLENLVKQIESIFGSYASTTANTRQLQLQRIFSQCADFKRLCNQQPYNFIFVSSAYKEAIDLSCMTAIGDADCSEKKVMLSLWPGLWKEMQPNDLGCLEPELVWAASL